MADRKPPIDLSDHNCINLRLPTLGGLYAWEFERDGKPLNVRVEGQLTTNDVDLMINAALDGRGLCCLPDCHLAGGLGRALLSRFEDLSWAKRDQKTRAVTFSDAGIAAFNKLFPLD